MPAPYRNAAAKLSHNTTAVTNKRQPTIRRCLNAQNKIKLRHQSYYLPRKLLTYVSEYRASKAAWLSIFSTGSLIPFRDYFLAFSGSWLLTRLSQLQSTIDALMFWNGCLNLNKTTSLMYSKAYLVLLLYQFKLMKRFLLLNTNLQTIVV